jgi:hypothetical protein
MISRISGSFPETQVLLLVKPAEGFRSHKGHGRKPFERLEKMG